jgi:Protein of unknown function (DUF3616)
VTQQKYMEACDASAATRIAGTTFFVAASDEDYILRVYDSEAPGRPVAQLDVTDFLEAENRTKEPDLEGSAQIGNRIYWIGSHGCDKEGHTQESRQRLFATEVAVGLGRAELRPLGKPYKQLLADLFDAPELAEFQLATAAALAPEAPGGLNIEGMASTPEGHLVVGFRNPIPRDRALLVRIENPGDVVAGTSRARVAAGRLLDLGGRGVRAFEPAGDGTYYLLAGAFDDTRNFALFSWDGFSSAPTLILDGTSLNDLNPEELIASKDTLGAVAVRLFSDDGDALVGAKKCKKVDPAVKSFRATTLQLAL